MNNFFKRNSVFQILFSGACIPSVGVRLIAEQVLGHLCKPDVNGSIHFRPQCFYSFTLKVQFVESSLDYLFI
jgi:hypothetical protein